MAQLRALLAARNAPLVLVGGSGWDAAACARSHHLCRGATRCRSPAPFATRTCSTTATPNYAGDVGIGINPAPRRARARRRRAAGAGRAPGRDGDRRLHAARRAAARTDAHPRPSRRRRTGTRVPAGAGDRSRDRSPRCAALAALPAAAAPAWAGSAAAAHADYLAWQTPQPMPGTRRPVAGRCAACASACRRTRSSPTAPATTRRGCTGCIATARYRTQLAPYSGAMGYGVPAAVAAKAVHPERVVVSWNGDGCFLMNGQELATAVQYGLAHRLHRRRQRACTARSACTRSATIRRASMAPISSIPISPRSRAPTAHTARRVESHRGIRPRARARRSRRAVRRCCT